MTAFLNNPLQVADVSLFADEIDGIGSTDMTVGREKFLRLINVLGVANVDESTVFTVKKLSGGITNALCIVILHLAGGDLPVVLRLFGIGTEQFIDRKVENIVFSKLSQSGDGPIFYGLFRTGRLEGFLPGMQCCEAEEMALRSVYIPVARTVAQLHHLPIKEVDMMQSDWLWNIIELFLKLGMAQDFSRRSEAQQEQLANLQLNKIRDEVTWYRGYIESLHEAIIADLVPTAQQGYFFGQRLALQRVLCHNDLLCGNIMRTSGVDVSDNSNEVAIKLIDYEYAGYNYRAYDLANHFCEFGGLGFDMPKDFPRTEMRRDFIRHYLAQVLFVEDPEDVDADIVRGFEDMTLRFSLAAHLMWGTWAVVQAGNSSLDFDYLAFAQLRFDGYYYSGNTFIGEAFRNRHASKETAAEASSSENPSEAAVQTEST